MSAPARGSPRLWRGNRLNYFESYSAQCVRVHVVCPGATVGRAAPGRCFLSVDQGLRVEVRSAKEVAHQKASQ